MTGKKWLILLIMLPLFVLSISGCDTEEQTTTAATGNLQFYVENASQNPLSGAKVVSESQPDGQLKVTGITYSDGIVTFNDIAAGDYMFYVNRADYFPVEVSLTVLEGETQNINIRMTASTTTVITAVPVQISFADLAADPESYNGKYVTIEGYWFDGFEIAVLAESLEPSDFAEGNVQPAGIKIWATGGLDEEVSDQLYLQADNSTGYPAHYGKVELTGIFEYGGEYGHLNSYSYQLTIYESQLILWTP